MSYLSFPSGRECILGVQGDRGRQNVKHPVAACGNLWRPAVAPLKKISCLSPWLPSCLFSWLPSWLASWLLSCLAAVLAEEPAEL